MIEEELCRLVISAANEKEDPLELLKKLNNAAILAQNLLKQIETDRTGWNITKYDSKTILHKQCEASC